MNAQAERRQKKRIKICRIKAVWFSKRRAAWRAKELSKETGQTFRHYRCDLCGKFHLTSH